MIIFADVLNKGNSADVTKLNKYSYRSNYRKQFKLGYSVKGIMKVMTSKITEQERFYNKIIPENLYPIQPQRATTLEKKIEGFKLVEELGALFAAYLYRAFCLVRK